MPVRMKFSEKAAGIEDQIVTFRGRALEFHFGAAFHLGDIEYFRVDVARAGAFVQQIRHRVGGQVLGVGHLLRREIVDKIAIAPTPSLKRHTVLAGSIQALLDGLMGKIGQFAQFLNEARPTAFSHSDYRDAGVIYVV